MRHLARGQRGLMDLDKLPCGQTPLNHRAAGAAVRRGVYRQLVEGEYLGVGEHRLCTGRVVLSLCHGTAHRCKSR